MNKEELSDLRHTTSHLLAAAVKKLFPDAKLAIGPATDEGFYYDIDVVDSISESDLPKIEKQMKKILPTWKSMERREESAKEAKKIYKDNPYKQELIDEIEKKGEKITLYKAGEFEDLCRGGHVKSPKDSLKAFKLLSIAGAYWRGDEKNKMLTRIYGTAFPSQKELDEYLKMREDALKRDHKKLGHNLDLFAFSDTVGKGLPLLTAKGATVRRELERFIIDEELKRGYQHVYTPDIANIQLYEKSGHYPYYKDSMYAPITIEDEKYMLRPMTCPHHFELYLTRPHSYRELPIRYAELAHLYRYEKSGELSGLLRVRTFTLADAHIIARPDQAEKEINGVLDLIEYIADVFKLKKGIDYHYRLSLGNREDNKKYFKDDIAWDFAENVLRKVLTKRKAHFVEAPDDAAFYGPKIDVQMKNVNGKEDTAFTVQYDFVMPQRFKLTYISESGTEEQPIVIHRSSIGAIERVMAFLIEKYAGNFPLWLAPTQVAVLPISEKVEEYASEVTEIMRQQGLRVELDTSPETLGSKIRKSTLQKIPLLCIIGEKEVEKGLSSGKKYIAVRTADGQDLGVQDLEDFLQKTKEQIEKKS